MRYFVDTSEDKRLDGSSREHLRGDFVDLTDGVTHYELCGPEGGHVAVLVGGLTIPLFYWDDVAPRLHERGVRTLTYSAYGRGYSDRVHMCYDEALFVRQLRELIETLELPTRHHLVGTSMGALIAMASIVEDATIATTLTLIGPAGLSTATAMQQRLLRSDLIITVVAKHFGSRILMGHLGHNVSDPQRSAELAAMIGDCYRYEGSMYAFFSTLQNFRLSSRAELYRRTGDLEIPTMLMWGTEDRVTPIDGLPQARELLRPERCHIIDNCGHMAPYERPAAVAELLATFTASQPDRLES
jgi:pimeloyl-ACP methyl ester carboxylesterase